MNSCPTGADCWTGHTMRNRSGGSSPPWCERSHATPCLLGAPAGACRLDDRSAGELGNCEGAFASSEALQSPTFPAFLVPLSGMLHVAFELEWPQSPADSSVGVRSVRTDDP